MPSIIGSAFPPPALPGFNGTTNLSASWRKGDCGLLSIEPIFEVDLQLEQYAYRPDRSALDAVKAVHALVNSGHTEVVDADLSGYFDSIPHSELMKSLARRISDRHVLHLLKQWLEMPVEEEDERGRKHRTTRNKDEGKGTPQGDPISPLPLVCSRMAGLSS